MKTKKIFVVLTVVCFLVLITNPASAAPFIESLGSSAIKQDDSLIISGINLGNKSSLSSAVWDNFEDGQCDTSATRGNWGSTNVLDISLQKNRHIFSNYTAHHNFQQTDTAGVKAQNSPTAVRWFIQYWVYLDENWDWGESVYLGDDNFLSNVKYLRLWNPGSEEENFYVSFWLCEGCNSFSKASYISDETKDFDISLSKSDITKGKWHCLQFEFQDSLTASSADAEFRCWHNGVLKENRTGFIARSNENLKRPFFIGFYNAWGSGNGHDNDYYMDDIYSDNSWARIEIGNDPVYNNCTHREIQIPTSWSDSEITIDVNQGSFEDGETAYVFVVDGDGEISEGYPVVFGNSVSACPEGKITSDCSCGENVYNGGLCCRGIWFDSSYEDISNGCPSGDFYFVDQNNPNANDSNAGTEELPWKTINKAAEALTTGDTVLVRGGTYDVVGTGKRNLPALNPANSGTADAPIIFKTYQGDKVIISMSSGTGPLIGSYGEINPSDYIIWDGFTIIEGSSYNPDTGPVTFFYTKGCAIQNCEIIGSYVSTTDNHDGIRIAHSSGLTIRNCVIRGVRGDSHNSAAIKFYYGNSNTVEHNLIYNCTVGIYPKGGDGKNNLIRFNTIRGCKSGFHISYHLNDDVYQNKIINCDYAFDIGSGDLVNYDLYNNVVFDCRYGIQMLKRPYENMSFWNNIFYKATQPFIFQSENILNIDLSDYHAFYNYQDFLLDWNPKTFLEWKSQTGLDQHSTANNPLFVDPNVYDFHLEDSSPCINAGIDLQDHDNDGDTSESINMGAYITGDEIIGLINLSEYIVSGQTFPEDTTPPTRSNPSPTGALPAGTAQATISLDTNENAECRYSTASGTAYADMADTFTTTGGMSHSQLIEGLQDGQSYAYHARCSDADGNFNTDDLVISFSIGTGDDADVDMDGKVDITELIAHIGRWKRGEVDMLRLMTAIGRWFRGE